MISFWLRMKTLWALRRNAARVVRLFCDQRVPAALKMAFALSSLAAISPLDPFSDVPVLGALDDVGMLLLLSWLFVRLCPRDVVAEYGQAAADARLKNVTP